MSKTVVLKIPKAGRGLGRAPVTRIGLMALLFYSSRKGYDEPSVLIAPEHDAMESKDVPEAK
jgi:hypothetical protein